MVDDKADILYIVDVDESDCQKKACVKKCASWRTGGIESRDDDGVYSGAKTDKINPHFTVNVSLTKQNLSQEL